MAADESAKAVEAALEEAAAAAEAEEGQGSGGAARLWGSVAAGALIGLAVGGVLGLLFAPKAGTELRGDIADALDGVKDRAEQLVDELQESATRLADRSRVALDQTRENIARSVEAGKEAYAQKRQELTSQMEGGPADGGA